MMETDESGLPLNGDVDKNVLNSSIDITASIILLQNQTALSRVLSFPPAERGS